MMYNKRKGGMFSSENTAKLIKLSPTKAISHKRQGDINDFIIENAPKRTRFHSTSCHSDFMTVSPQSDQSDLQHISFPSSIVEENDQATTVFDHFGLHIAENGNNDNSASVETMSEQMQNRIQNGHRRGGLTPSFEHMASFFAVKRKEEEKVRKALFSNASKNQSQEPLDYSTKKFK